MMNEIRKKWLQLYNDRKNVWLDGINHLILKDCKINAFAYAEYYDKKIGELYERKAKKSNRQMAEMATTKTSS